MYEGTQGSDTQGRGKESVETTKSKYAGNSEIGANKQKTEEGEEGRRAD